MVGPTLWAKRNRCYPQLVGGCPAAHALARQGGRLASLIILVMLVTQINPRHFDLDSPLHDLLAVGTSRCARSCRTWLAWDEPFLLGHPR